MLKDDTSEIGEKNSLSVLSLNSILDPKEEHPGILQLLAGMDDNILDSIIFLCAGYSEAEVKVISDIAASNLVSCQLDSAPDNGGILHHAAVIAPVVVDFGSGFPTQWVWDAIVTLRKELERYWKCVPADFHLNSTNRFLFARGAAMCFFITEGEALPSWSKDAHFIWTGSKFEDVRSHATEILNARSIDDAFIDSLSMDWVPEEAILEDGSLDDEFEKENRLRIEGTCEPPSVLTEEEWEIVEDSAGEPDFRLGQLSFNRWYLPCLTHFTGEITDDIPFINTLLELTEGMDEPVDVSETALMLMEFDAETIKLIDRVCAKYDEDERTLLLDTMDYLAEDVRYSNREIFERTVKFTAATAPLLSEFIATDTDDTDIEGLIETIGEEHAESQVAIQHYYELLDSVEDCYQWSEVAVAMEDYRVSPKNYVDLMRGLTACHLIGHSTIEDSTVETITSIGRKMRKLIMYSDSIMTTGDLSKEGLDNIHLS